MKKGHVATLDINVLLLKHPPNKFENFEEEVQYIITHNRRNNFIKNLALDLKGNTLILFARVEGHGLPLYELINKNKIDNQKVFFVHGGVDTEDRKRLEKSLKRRKMQLLLRRMGLLVLVLILSDYITSSSRRHQNQEYEIFSQ